MKEITKEERSRMLVEKVFVSELCDIYKDLEEVAAQRHLTYYQKIGQDHSIPFEHNMLGATLAECSVYSYRQHGFLLSALVTHKRGQQDPGGGFFDLAFSLGYSFPNTTKGREAFWIDQVNRIYAHYSKLN